MKLINRPLIGMSLLLVSLNASADWSYSYNTFKKNYWVTDGSQVIQYKKKKSAEDAVETLNKADVSKKEEGKVWDDGSGNCNRPGIEC